jgi:hypothetical protein
MACLIPTNLYFPLPTREWSRVQSPCSMNINPTLSLDELSDTYQMRLKGNILQYKKNSGNLTQKQKYSLIAQGKWVNRNTTWATQSTRGYTNPNVQSLRRVGGSNTTLDGTPTTLPVTCPKSVIIFNSVLPPNIYSPYYEPEQIPEPGPDPELPEEISEPPGVNSGTAIPIVPPAPTPDPIVIPNNGNLVCQTFEDICTGTVINNYSISNELLNNCNLTSASNVPGQSVLCWNDRIQTWYPRQRYIMTNSGNKWPTNAVLFSAIRPPPK